jgi:hypothetical protein
MRRCDWGQPGPSSVGDSQKNRILKKQPNRISCLRSPAGGKQQTAWPKRSLTKTFFLPKTGRGSHEVGEEEERVNRHRRTSGGEGRDRKVQAGRATHEPKMDTRLKFYKQNQDINGSRESIYMKAKVCLSSCLFVGILMINSLNP